MKSNRVSIELPKELNEEILKKLEEIKKLIEPYTVSITVEERGALPKMKDKSLAFVSKALSYSQTNPTYVPKDLMSVPEMAKDFNLNQSLQPMIALVEQLDEKLVDMAMLSGHEAYTEALLYYKSVKMYAQAGDSAAKVIYDDLSTRFPGARSSKKAEESKS